MVTYYKIILHEQRDIFLFINVHYLHLVNHYTEQHFGRACCASKTTMAGVVRRVRNLFKLLLLLYIVVRTTHSVTYIDEESPSDCTNKQSDAEFHEFYDISQLRCEKCDQTSTFQTVSKDGELCESSCALVVAVLSRLWVRTWGQSNLLCTYC